MNLSITAFASERGTASLGAGEPVSVLLLLGAGLLLLAASVLLARRAPVAAVARPSGR
ncbi:MAG: hypothetical protein SF051_12490 [Elusimicrobiota bacterium]|nr:hypothetical protein [Elusimicrobiota bacterium]